VIRRPKYLDQEMLRDLLDYLGLELAESVQ